MNATTTIASGQKTHRGTPASFLINTGEGDLDGLIISSLPAASGWVDLYDNASEASGKRLIPQITFVGTGDLEINALVKQLLFPKPVHFFNGCCLRIETSSEFLNVEVYTSTEENNVTIPSGQKTVHVSVGTASWAIKACEGNLDGIIISGNPAARGTVDLYDNASEASGKRLIPQISFLYITVETNSKIRQITFPKPVHFFNGCYLKMTSTQSFLNAEVYTS